MSDSRPETLRALADLLRAGLSMRAALVAWHEEVPGDEIEKLSRRLRLGEDTTSAITTALSGWGSDAERLALIVRLASRLGGNGAVMLELFADSIHDTETARRGGRAAAAGAVLSGRMVAGLPLAFLPLTPMARAPLLDGPGILLIALGVGFAAVGMWWIHRLVPRPSTEDPAADAAELTAALVSGGVALPVALDEVSAFAGNQDFERARRLVRLGATWNEALSRSPDAGLAELATTIARAERFGMSIAVSLRELACRRRRNAKLAFDAATRKAPVVMVVPLVLCVLPSFCLLALAPFLRGLVSSG